MRIGGVMTPEQEAQLAEASVQLKEMEAQLANMPASQRQMMESMMGPQLEMIRNMAAGGGMEFVQEVTELRCNTGLPDPAEISQTMLGGAGSGLNVGAMLDQERAEMAARDEQERADAAARKVASEEEMREITAKMQASLVALGYQPGNTDGVLDEATVVAISQFEAVRGLPVTGQPSWELAGILGRAVEDGAFRAPR
jgi:DNA repair exonuclease SbcCD ATPase subunit